MLLLLLLFSKDCNKWVFSFCLNKDNDLIIFITFIAKNNRAATWQTYIYLPDR